MWFTSREVIEFKALFQRLEIETETSRNIAASLRETIGKVRYDITPNGKPT